MADIKHRWSGATLGSTADGETLQEAVQRIVRERYADLSGANLRGADLSGADLSNADLSGANLSYANLRGADLSGTDMRNASMSGADISYADLSGANLRHADLSGASMRGTDLSGADLRDVDLSGADLNGAMQYVLRIQGSRDAITAIDADVRIGCVRMSLDEWLVQHEVIGLKHGYTDREIAEYGAHLRHVKAMLSAKEAKR